MPTRQQIKDYSSDCHYHLYNRGVGKMTIFHDGRDYQSFLHQLRMIFTPVELLHDELKELESLVTTNSSLLRTRIKSLNRAINKSLRYKTPENIKLLAFSLLPNHFHLVVYQAIPNGIEQVMRRLGTAYSMHYKNKYDWVGSVTQGRYSASCLSIDPKLQPITAAFYVERNILDLLSQDSPVKTFRSKGIEDYPYSSFQFYFRQIKKGQRPPPWLATDHLLKIFDEIKKNPNSPLEELVAKYDNYVDFVLSGADINLEDVRLMHLNSI
jgi:putative transposase